MLTGMEYPLFYRILASLFAFVIMPAMALAQTASTTAPTDTAGTTPTQWHMMGQWRQSSQLQQEITALGSTPVMAFQIPILFGVSLGDFTPNFGDPRSGGRTHEGEDIMAPLDTPIVSPTSGVVLRTETGVSEGNAVYEAAPGGYTFVYMHLDKFGEGVVAGGSLQQGSLIGYVGNTGDAADGPTHLHFEVHDPSGTPIDPMPFLVLEFTPQQKITFLSAILTQTSEPLVLSQLLVTNFRSTFTNDAQSGIALPPLITGALSTVSVTPPTSGDLPAGDLMLGSSGSAVATLQQFLIAKATGPAAVRLAGAGATGNFGPITEAALVEYQSAVGISPADGYYGPATRAAVAANAGAQPPATTSVSAFTRDLYYGISGQDVLALQKLLNVHGFTVAASGPGSSGAETTYFGPATQAAVIRFQVAHSVTPAVGYVGPLTRAALASL